MAYLDDLDVATGIGSARDAERETSRLAARPTARQMQENQNLPLSSWLLRAGTSRVPPLRLRRGRDFPGRAVSVERVLRAARVEACRRGHRAGLLQEARAVVE